METNLDLSRWREKPKGVDYRRWTIVATGLRQMLANRVFRGLLSVAWTAGVLIAIFGFAFTQSVASGGWLESAAANFGPRAEAVVAALGALVTLYPDICIHGLFTLVFWLHSYLGLGLSLVALTMMVPHLVARDRASNALTIYLSRPLTSAKHWMNCSTVAASPSWRWKYRSMPARNFSGPIKQSTMRTTSAPFS